MTNLSPSAQDIIDSEHLRLLSLFHFIVGSLHALFSCVLIFHVVLGLVMAVGPHLAHGHGQGPPTVIGLLMSAFSGCFMLLGWLWGGLTIYSGVCIKRRQHRLFSLIVAVLNCLSVPLGTILGVWTLSVLARPSVKEQYQRTALAPGSK
jgi:hypothetical protein